MTFPGYELFFALGLTAGFALWLRRSRVLRLSTEKASIIALSTLGCALLGAALLFRFTAHEWGGFVFYGGFFAGTGAFFVSMHRAKIARSEAANAVVPALSLGHAVGRLGCLVQGCCFGTHCDLPWAIHGLHPTQLYESLFLFILTFVLLRRPASSRWPAAKVYLVSYGVFRFLNEFLRGDTIRGFWGPLSTSQWVSLVVILSGILSGLWLDFRSAGDHNQSP